MVRIETGGHLGLSINDCLCQLCFSGVEDELHFIFYSQVYRDERQLLYSHMCTEGYANFDRLTDVNKLFVLCTLETRRFAKYLVTIFEKRQNLMYTN